MVRALLVGELPRELPHVRRIEHRLHLFWSVFVPLAGIVEILIEQRQQVLTLDELAGHRAYRVVPTLLDHGDCGLGQFDTHTHGRGHRSKRRVVRVLGHRSDLGIGELPRPEPRVDRKPILDIDQHGQDRRDVLVSSGAVALVNQRTSHLSTIFFGQLTTRFHGETVVTGERPGA